MKIAASIVGYGFNLKELDLLISLYEVVLKKKGDTDLDSITTIKVEVDDRENARHKEDIAKKLEEAKKD